MTDLSTRATPAACWPWRWMPVLRHRTAGCARPASACRATETSEQEIPDMDYPQIQTDITRMFGLQIPVIGAPMFLVSREELVAAVTSAGGLGTFPSLNYRSSAEFRSALATVRARVGDRPIGVNLIARDT